MNIFGRLFGSDEVIKKAASGLYNGIDKAIYTNEEKAENFTTLLRLYEPFKIAQRLLALTFGIPYALAWLITFVSSFFRDNVDAQLAILSGTMGQIVLAIIAFYFLGGTLTGLRKQT
jgi:hypothetical protein